MFKFYAYTFIMDLQLNASRFEMVKLLWVHFLQPGSQRSLPGGDPGTPLRQGTVNALNGYLDSIFIIRVVLLPRVSGYPFTALPNGLFFNIVHSQKR